MSQTSRTVSPQWTAAQWGWHSPIVSLICALLSGSFQERIQSSWIHVGISTLDTKEWVPVSLHRMRWWGWHSTLERARPKELLSTIRHPPLLLLLLLFLLSWMKMTWPLSPWLGRWLETITRALVGWLNWVDSESVYKSESVNDTHIHTLNNTEMKLNFYIEDWNGLFGFGSFGFFWVFFFFFIMSISCKLFYYY